MLAMIIYNFQLNIHVVHEHELMLAHTCAYIDLHTSYGIFLCTSQHTYVQYTCTHHLYMWQTINLCDKDDTHTHTLSQVHAFYSISMLVCMFAEVTDSTLAFCTLLRLSLPCILHVVFSKTTPFYNSSLCVLSSNITDSSKIVGIHCLDVLRKLKVRVSITPGNHK